jgi:glycosyltransferase involved in cell wall biosynthesis
MVFGVPIVASDIPAHKELCREAAIYFDVHSAQDLVEKILLLSKDAGLRRQLAANGVKRAAMFSWQSHVNVIYGIMEELKR